LYNSLRKAFDDGGLSYTGFSDQYRLELLTIAWNKGGAYIVLCPAGQDSDCSTNFLVSADNWIDISLPGLFRQVDSILGKRLILFFGILRIDSLCSRSLLNSGLECFGCNARFLQCFLQNWIFDKCCNNMILRNVRVLLSLLNGLCSSEEFEGCRTKRYLLWRRFLNTN
jgi:hypothetical protein